MKLYMYLDRLPPSVNAMYANIRNGRILTPAGRAFKQYAKVMLGVQLYKSKLTFLPDVPCSLTLVFDFLSIHNKSAGKIIPSSVDKKSGKVIPEKRVGLFTKKDVSNLVKCVEDSVMDVVGIDDHHNVTVAMMKRKAPKEGVHIMLTAGEDNAVDTAILSLLDQMAGAHVP